MAQAERIEMAFNWIVVPVLILGPPVVFGWGVLANAVGEWVLEHTGSEVAAGLTFGWVFAGVPGGIALGFITA